MIGGLGVGAEAIGGQSRNLANPCQLMVVRSQISKSCREAETRSIDEVQESFEASNNCGGLYSSKENDKLIMGFDVGS